jgi:hypothetical protein
MVVWVVREDGDIWMERIVVFCVVGTGVLERWKRFE